MRIRSDRLSREAVAWLLALGLLGVGILDAAERGSGHPKRRTHQVRDVRTEHFVVLTTSSRERAQTVARELEVAWSELAYLTGEFGSRDSNRKAPRAAIAVVLTEAHDTERRAQMARRFADARSPVLNLTTSGTRGWNPAKIAEARRALAGPYFRQMAPNQRLPQWVVEGLGAYLAGDFNSPPLAEDREHAVSDRAAQVGFYLTAADGAYAHEFLHAVESTLNEPLPRFRNWKRESAGQAVSLPSTEVARFDRLANQRDVVRSTQSWLKNPLAGQPVLVNAQNANDPQGVHQREMAMVLKLAGTLAATDTKADGESRELLTEESLQRLRTRLLNEESAAWTTLDGSGRLRFSRDQAWRQQLANSISDHYTIAKQGQRTVLRFQQGTSTIDAWASENPSDPSRPRVTFAVR